MEKPIFGPGTPHGTPGQVWRTWGTRSDPRPPDVPRSLAAALLQSPDELRQGLAAVDYAALHYEGDVLEHADVVERVAGHGDDVGVVAGFEHAQVVLPVE